MFAHLQLHPAGYFTSRAELLGFTDAEIERISTRPTSPARIEEINRTLEAAARALYERPGEGGVH